MRLKYKHIFLLILVFLLTACEEKVNGYLEVKDSFFLETTNGSIELKPGRYVSQMKMGMTKNVEFSIYYNKKDYISIIKLSKIKIPNKSDFELKIKGSQVNTPFDMITTLKTKKSFSDERFEYSACLDENGKIRTTKLVKQMKTLHLNIDMLDRVTSDVKAHFKGIAIDDSDKILKESKCE